MLVKLDASGSRVWSQQVIHDDLIRFNDVAVEGNTVYVAGSFLGSVNFDPNAADATVISRGDRDAFIARYDSNLGDLTDVQRVGGGGFDSLYGLSVYRDSLDRDSLLVCGVASPPNADFLTGRLNDLGQMQMSAFVPVMTREVYTMRLSAAAPVVQANYVPNGVRSR